jgi:hypothetical protein
MPSTVTSSKPATTAVRADESRPFALLVGVGVYVLVTLAILIVSARLTSGHLFYPLDDAYIEMAMAKNIAVHGVWGVSPYEFTSSTSTPLFVLLLSAIYRIFGVSEYAPLVLSWIFGLASIYVASRMLRKYLSNAWQTTILVTMVLFTPMFVIGTMGMEHSLHLLLTLLFLQQIDEQDSPIWSVAVVTMLMVATRYEGLFFALTGVGFLLLFRQFAKALAVAVSASIPVSAYALFSIHHGGYWLPNSVAIKGINIHGLDLIGRATSLLSVTESNVLRGMHVVFLLAALSIAAITLRKHDRRAAALLGVVAGSCCIHLVTADVGWTFRYEAYLIGSGVVILACSFARLREFSRASTTAAGCFLFCSGAVLLGISLNAATTLPLRSRTVYLQQWQMAEFLKAYYPNAKVAANDIGAINFMNDLHNLDLFGLASADVFAAKRDQRYSTGFIEQSASKRDIQIAMVYDNWFSPSAKPPFAGPPLPKRWIRVRRWTIPNEKFLGGRTVSFYALNPDAAVQLQTNLLQFERTMPRAVEPHP